MKKMLCTALAAIMMTAALPSAVCANEFYTEVDVLAGIRFDSAEKLEECIASGDFDGVDNDVYRYLSNADFLYVPQGYTDKTSEINDIIITPTYIRTNYDNNGNNFSFYHYHNKTAGKNEYSTAADMAESGNFSGEDKDGVYYYEVPYFDDYEGYYCFKQDGEYFIIRSLSDMDSEILPVCGAEKYSFEDTFESVGLQNINGDIYYINEDGSYARGWREIDGDKYYFTKGGKAAVKNMIIGGVYQRFDSDGKYIGKYTGWAKRSDKYFYYKNGLAKKSCWIRIGKNKYYLKSDGSRAVGKVKINGVTYTFDKNGRLITK